MPEYGNDNKDLSPFNKGSVPHPSTQKQVSERSNAEQTVYIEELKKVAEELRQARRAALNLMEDAILSRESLRINEERMRRQKEALQAAINGAALEDALNIIAGLVTEEMAGEARTAFYIADAAETSLHPVFGAGTMQESYLKQVDGFHIGEDSLACGLAFPTGRPIITQDVFEEPLWKPWIHLAEAHHFHGCWSFPLISRDNKTVGTFAMYYTEPRKATAADHALADVVTQTAAVIISSYINAQERVRAEEALRESEKRFRSLITATSDIVYKMSADWSVMINLKGMDFLSDADEPVENWLEKYIPEHSQSEVKAAIEQAITAKSIFELEHPVRQLNNTVGWVRSRAVPLLNAQDEITEWFGAATDITQRKRYEQRQELLNEISKELVGLETIETTMGLLGEKIAKHFGVSWCLFVEMIEDGGTSVVSYGWNAEGSISLKGTYRIRDFLSHEQMAKNNAGELSIVSDTQTDPNVSGETYGTLGIRSFIMVPLSRNGQWKFQLVIIHNEPREWDDTEIEFVKEIASRIWTRLERARAEEALRKNEARFRTLANAVPQVIWTNNAEGQANYFNQRWYDYSGLTYEQSKGLGWQVIVHPDDAPASVEKWKQALIAGEIFDTEYRLRRSDGTYRWFIGRNMPLKDDSGKIIGWFGTATDIEDLKKAQEELSESEAKLKITMETATDYAIITMDTERKVEKWSRGAEQIFGYTEDEIIGKSADIIFTEEDRKVGAPQKEMETARDTGRAIDERWHRRKDGSRFYVSGVMRPIQNGELTGYVKVARDMTQQQLFTEELHRLVAERTIELQRSNEDLRQFAHVTSHDLKEPIRKIQTFNNRILDEYADALPHKVKTYSHKIGAAADRMISMIEGVLRYSKLGNVEQVWETVDLNETIRQITSDLEVLIQQKGAVITAAELPTLTANPTLMYQLFYNLILNSLKFAKEDEPSRINISFERVKQDETPFALITLSDNGIGFEPEFNEQIFKTFVRLHPVESYEGTGLGLALCKKIVERHGGTILASGNPDKGATFTILLPLGNE